MKMGEIADAPPKNGNSETTQLVFSGPGKSETDTNASVGTTIVTMANNMIGSGFVVLAYTIKEVGIVMKSQLSVRWYLACFC